MENEAADIAYVCLELCAVQYCRGKENDPFCQFEMNLFRGNKCLKLTKNIIPTFLDPALFENQEYLSLCQLCYSAEL